MADKKISQLTSASTPLAGTESVEVVQGGSSYKTTAKAIGNSADALPFASLAGRAYGQFYSSTDQTGSTSAGTAAIFENTLLNTGVTMVTDGVNLTRLTLAAAGTYRICAQLQIGSVDAAVQSCSVWLRKNGTDVVGSNRKVSLPVSVGQMPVSIEWLETVTAGQYLQVMWCPSDTDVTLDAAAAAAGPPAIPLTPSAMVSAERIV